MNTVVLVRGTTSLLPEQFTELSRGVGDTTIPVVPVIPDGVLTTSGVFLTSPSFPLTVSSTAVLRATIKGPTITVAGVGMWV